MLKLSMGKIPNLESLVVSIKDLLANPSQDLDDIREVIYNHISCLRHSAQIPRFAQNFRYAQLIYTTEFLEILTGN
jgi:hypothetical protein